MKNKKIGIIVFIILIISIVGYGIYHYRVKTDNTTTLTLAEKQWIENNKNKVFDMSITNDIPVFNYNGEGIFFDFLNALEKDTNLEFNKVPYTYGKGETSGYAFQIKKEVSQNDILLYEDTYSLITKEKVKYSQKEEIKNLVIGVMNTDLESVGQYLSGVDVTFKSFETKEELISAIEDDSVQAIVVPQLIYLKLEIENEDLFLSYQLEGLTEKYVLSLSDNDKLNTILKKYYTKWSKEQFDNAFNKYFTSNYFEFSNTEEKDKVNFKSKRYTYGFIENRPYDALAKNKLYGINSNILREFSKLADIEISYMEYSNMESLVKAINENKIDFFFGTNANTTYDTDVYNTVSITDEKIVILTDVKNDVLISSISALKGKEVSVLKGTKISNYLSSNGVTVKEYDTLRSLFSNLKEKSVLALDLKTYEYYSRNELERFIPIYEFQLNDVYGYVIRDIDANQVFENFLNFYLSFTNENQFVSQAYDDLFVFRSGNHIFLTILTVIIGGVVGLFAIFGLYKYIHTEKKQASLTKGDRIRYIDQLTSLKNRNYLNDNIEAWDESEVYPQSIIIVDLNNIAYINDNYGHQEGDNVIKEAANILIKSQISNSDIIRTNGNEFLIYLVGYDEKQIVSYIRKLNKELKELAHGFGAAIGYSMINDAIKTIDDAVNEATLDMRAAKEENNNEK